MIDLQDIDNEITKLIKKKSEGNTVLELKKLEQKYKEITKAIEISKEALEDYFNEKKDFDKKLLENENKLSSIEMKLQDTKLNPSELQNYNLQKSNVQVLIEDVFKSIDLLNNYNKDGLIEIEKFQNELSSLKPKLVEISKMLQIEWKDIDSNMTKHDQEKSNLINSFPDEIKFFKYEYWREEFRKQVDLPSSSSWRQIVYTAGRYLLIDPTGGLLTSTDGDTWVPSSAGSVPLINSNAWTLVGTNGRFITSGGSDVAGFPSFGSAVTANNRNAYWTNGKIANLPEEPAEKRYYSFSSGIDQTSTTTADVNLNVPEDVRNSMSSTRKTILTQEDANGYFNGRLTNAGNLLLGVQDAGGVWAAGTIGKALEDISTTPGDKGDGWTGGSYDDTTGKVTFTSDDGLGFSTDDLRGEDGNLTDGKLKAYCYRNDVTNVTTAYGI